MSSESKAQWLEFLGKLITPVTIIILVLSFKSTVEERLSQASEVSVLGSSFKFHTNTFEGDLSALEVYYLIHANLNSDRKTNISDLETKRKAAIYLLESKSIISLELTESSMPGEFYYLKLEAKGKELINKLGLQ